LKEFAETLEGICTKFASGSKVLELFTKSELFRKSRENFVPDAYIALSQGTDDLIRKTISSSRRTGLVKYCLFNKGNLRERKVLMEDSWEALKFKCN